VSINTQRFSVILSNAVASVQGAAATLIDFASGSVVLAIMQAVSAIALWLQAIALQVAALTRLATSSGSDVDTWLADYNFYRLPAVSATTSETFSRFTPTAQAVIQVGQTVQSADGTQSYTVIADTSQTAYNATLNAYVIPASVSSCTATIKAVTPGTGANVGAGLISVLGSSIPGVDTVTNALAVTNGFNAESDTAVKARFVLYIQSLTQGTKAACINAVLNMQLGASCAITENINYSGFAQPGYFYAVVDDGTGTPSPTFLSAAYAAIDAVRAEGTIFGVFAPVVVTANAGLTITVSTGYTLSAVKTLVGSAISQYINSLGAGATLPYTKLSQLAYGASPGITNVTAVTLNGGTADVVATGQQLIRAGVMTIGP
jgi:uncharacterized phage protein gp47/JayE